MSITEADLRRTVGVYVLGPSPIILLPVVARGVADVFHVAAVELQHAETDVEPALQLRMTRKYLRSRAADALFADFRDGFVAGFICL